MVKPHNYKYCSERVWFIELSHQYLHNWTSVFLQAHHLTQSCYDLCHTQISFKLTNITIYTGSYQRNYTINQKITLKVNTLHIYNFELCHPHCVIWTSSVFRMFIAPCIIVIVQELKTNLMSLVIFISLIICSTCFGH